MKVIKILIVVEVHIEFSLYQMDIKSALLNSYLYKEVYLHQPPKFENHDHPS